MTQRYSEDHSCGKNIQDNGLRESRWKLDGARVLVQLCFGILFALEWIAGLFLQNPGISHLGLATYVLYLVTVFYVNPKFVFTYFWIIIAFSLNVLGVWVCETQGIYLLELVETTFYTGSLPPLLMCYFLFYAMLEGMGLKKQERMIRDDRENQSRLAVGFLYVGIVCVAVLLLQIIKTPYFAVGLERIPYLQTYTSGWERSLKAHMLMFVPLAGICGRNGYMKQMCAFMGLLLMYYFWVGDKFGAYLLALYLFVISYFVDINAKRLRTIVFSCVGIVALLLGVVFVQRILLFGNSLDEFLGYLFHRLAQQGEVWWSVFRYEDGNGWRAGEFLDEIMALLPGSDIAKAEAGQWKMMIVSSNYSAYSYYRVDVGNPYTTTTTASVFYYFKWLGLGVFYVFSALLYKGIICSFVDALRSNRVLETMILVKLISFSNSLLAASDGYLFTYKGLVYLFAAIVLIYLRKRRIKMSVKYENRRIDFI